MKRILIVEDETSIREMIELNLKIASYDIVATDSAENAIDILLQDTIGFDIAILDVMLPKMDGFALCEYIRKFNNGIGILILSAKSQISDKINGLSIGADDYMTKPFSITELLARIEALCRRSSRDALTQTKNERIISGVFSMDFKNRLFYKYSNEIELTQIEFQIMEFFFNHPGTALSREDILYKVWGENYIGDVKIVDVNIRRLRMKIESDPSVPQHIITVWGMGYRWNG